LELFVSEGLLLRRFSVLDRRSA